MPARRSQNKTSATTTPLAAMAPAMPPRPAQAEEAGDAPREDAAVDEVPVARLPTGDADSASTGTPDETQPPDEPVPAPSRRGARKIAPRRTSAGVPRTIAELQRQEAGETLPEYPEVASLTTEANVEAPPPGVEDAIPQGDAEPPVLLVPLRVVVLTVAVIWLLAGLIPQIVLVVAERAGLSGAMSLYAYDVALLLGGGISLLILLRAVRGAFGPTYHDLSWRTIPEIWSRRTPSPSGGLPRRDGWATAGLAALGGFLFLAGLLLFNALQRAPASLPYLPYLLTTIFARAVLGATFLGLLQPALGSTRTRSRAALTTGIVYGLAVAVLNGFVVALSPPTADGQGQTAALSAGQLATAVALSALISLIVGIGVAWFRLRAHSVWAAVAFQLTLLLLQFPV